MSESTTARRPKLTLATLEERSLMAVTATFNPDTGVLRVEGTDEADIIRIVNNAGQVSVEGCEIAVLGGNGGPPVASLAAADISYARADGLGGDDRIEMVQTGVTADQGLVLEADGGAGNDTLVGGSAADRLSGGPDTDQLVGGAGADQLDGGGQQDALFQETAIDATALLQAYFSVDYVPQDSAAPFGIDLAPGDHFVYTHGSAVVWFKIEADGTVSYDPALEGIFTGQGTSALTVRGVEVQIDTSALFGTYMTVDYVPKTPGETLTTRLLPGDHFVYTHGSAVAWFKVETDGTVSYDPTLEGILTGQGTSELQVNGAVVRIDTGTLHPTYMSVDYVPQTPGEALTTRLLPGDHFVYTHGSAVAWFKVETDGTVSYDPALEGILTGQGTNELQVNGAEVNIDATALFPVYTTVDYVVQDPREKLTTRLVPGDHFVYTHAGAVSWFKVGTDGKFNYDPTLEGILTGQGTNSLKLNGRTVSFNPGAMADKPYSLDYVAIDPDQPFQANLLPGQHFISTVSGNVLYFTVGVDGVTDYDPALEGVISDMTAALGLDGVLRVRGTNKADTIRLVQEGDRLRVDGLAIAVTHPDGTVTSESSVSIELVRIEVEALGESDTVFMERLSGVNWGVPMRIVGGDGNDTLKGFTGNDTIFGGRGHDFLYGNWGIDWLYGDDDNDTLYGDEHNDALDGQRGNDTLYGGTGHDGMVGNEGIDSLVGGDGRDTLWGAAWQNNYTYQDGSNTLVGGEEADEMHGGNAADTFWGYGGNDTMWGGVGKDTMRGGWGNDWLWGEDGDDGLYGEYDNDALDGGKGTDVLEGDWGNDNLVGGEGLDFLHGGFDNDTLFGAGWQDNYNYQDAGNFLYGNDGNDNLYGGNGNDFMDAGVGHDGLFGGLGSNTLRGMAGRDRFLVRAGEAVDDLDPEDARLTFTAGDRNWMDGEIYLVDTGLAFLHATTNNTRLLEMSPARGGGELTFQRVQTLGATTLGDNDDMGRIRITDWGFTSGFPMVENVIHEIGHNWDDATERGSTSWDQWRGLSGWQPHNNGGGSLFPPDGYLISGDGQWDYRATADNAFHRNYGKTNPYEDWSTMWEAYFKWKTGTLSAADVSRLQAKLNFIDGFMAAQRS
jgi:Ca2+-binding RTX toxin-like protein